ncbi:MAG: FkbM family methyltransferase [Gammaproteobacteria bacterium]|nr:FkbM family methyltransferase [Gammaproteobacteria bacterium]NIR82383.1 FkbM family methyltransferase [Gammaproteobacteria bacterium]NIU03528.1 FkbM family methyltransferase [Gammaproteobacteria bacterium]NIX84802.1 FkbM family methyltransferase [Gammaproteobacteria bacterium]
MTVYLGRDTALVRTVFGDKMYVDTRDTVVAPHLLLDGDWEPWIREFLTAQLSPGMRFVDVGAHLGWYTLLARHIVGDEGSVVAMDPVHRHVHLLRRSLAINGYRRVEVHCGAASDHDGQLRLQCDVEWSGNARVSTDGELIACVRLDHFVQTADFVKIDAELHEPAVLRGMAELIENNPQIQLLVEHHRGETLEAEARELSQLVRAGFKLGVVEHDGLLSELDVGALDGVPDSEMLYLARPR